MALSRPSGGPITSVLLPAFQAESTLPATLASLTRQDDPAWECVIVDDGSNDGTRAIAEAAARRDPRIRTISTGHQGLVAALNTGLAACRGRYVARLDADDLCRRDRLRLQRAALEASPDLALVGAHVRHFPRPLTDGRASYERWLNAIDTPDAVRREAYVECPLAHPTLFAHAEVLRQLGYADTDWPEDYDLVLRALSREMCLGIVPRRLLAWRDTPRRLQRTDTRYSIEAFTACKAHHLARGFLAGGDDYVLWGHGGTGRALRHALTKHGKRPSAIVELHPGRLGNVIDGAPVIPPRQLTRHRPGRLVTSVAGEPARGEIRATLKQLGWREGTDYICAA